MILAGDIGGTKTVLALFDGRAGPLMPVREATLASRQYARFEDVLQTFLGDRAPGAIAAACFGVAGPVVDGRVVTTNLPWQLDEAALLLTIPTTRVRLLNDLEATAHGVLGLGPESLYTLQPGRSRTGNIAVKGLAVGGVFVAGGIAPKILPRLGDGRFVDSFRSKGRMAELLADIPIQVVLESRTALLGAAQVALDLTRR